jgi:hypothetical protein
MQEILKLAKKVWRKITITIVKITAFGGYTTYHKIFGSSAGSLCNDVASVVVVR